MVEIEAICCDFRPVEAWIASLKPEVFERWQEACERLNEFLGSATITTARAVPPWAGVEHSRR
eukprot:2401909-Lingulodinium_polyedra.AAC.1